MKMNTRIATYTLRIMGPKFGDDPDDTPKSFDKRNQDALDQFRDSNALSQAEDVINDNLPEGYYAKIDEY